MEENALALLHAGAELTDIEMNALSVRLWELLSRRAKLYAIDSSSVRVETAQDLLSSICFLLHLYLQEHQLPLQHLLEVKSLDTVYDAALETGREKICFGKTLYHEVCESTPPIENISLIDTLREIGQFFKTYNVYFFAQQADCCIDYQLCNAVPETLVGIEYICEYLQRLLMEDHFLTHFSTENIIALLKVYCPDYKGLLINLYEPVFTNALCLALLGKPIFGLNMTPTQKSELLKLTMGLSEVQTQELFHQAAKTISLKADADPAETAYAMQAAAELYPRFHAVSEGGSLGGFVCSW